MKKSIVLIVLFSIFSLLSIAQDKKANNIDNSNIALSGYRAVSYADLGLAQKGVQNFNSSFAEV